jgi:hypothetical protein
MAQNGCSKELCRSRLEDKNCMQNGQTAEHEALWVSEMYPWVITVPAVSSILRTADINFNYSHSLCGLVWSISS